MMKICLIRAVTVMLAFFTMAVIPLTGCRDKDLLSENNIQTTDLDSGFISPPDSARTRTWWHWINGIVSKEGITRDLEAIKGAGIGGVHLFQQGDTIIGPATFGSGENLELIRFAAQEAERLGLEFTMSDQPGCAGSGGPWITPDLSMQMMVWSEATVTGGKKVDMDLPKPYAKLGWYSDSMVVAFPSLKGEEKDMIDLLKGVTTNAGAVDACVLTDYDLEGGVDVAPGLSRETAFILMEFAEPFEVRSIYMYFSDTDANAFEGGAPGMDSAAGPSLEASDDGVNFTKVETLTLTKNGEGPIVPLLQSVSAVRARFFRVTFPDSGMVSELRLSGAVRFADWGTKTNLAQGMEGVPGAPGGAGGAVEEYPAGSAIDPDAVLDISGFMDENGRLSWQAPEGNWTILRIGHTSTGTKGHPQPEGGQGLESDHFSREAMDFHFRNMFGEIISILKELNIKGVAGGLIDSYEAGNQNWTALLPEEFEKRRGYDIARYVPAMTGRLVGSADITDRFLWDLRRTEADLMADNFYGRFAELCRENNMTSYAEAYGGNIMEQMQASSRVDVPMGEFWTATGYQNSIKTAASVAHTNGKPIVSAESFTSEPTYSKWQEYPYSLKAQGDLMYTLGLNQMVFHQYVHQANINVSPGLTMRSVGSMINMNNTWWEQSRPWQDYMARCQYMLSKGLFAGDVLYFTGEDVSSSAGLGSLNPEMPGGYDYDTVDSETILNNITVQDGLITLPDGITYSVLVLPDKEMSLKMAARLKDLVKEGMNLVVTGPAPSRCPGLSSYPDGERQLRDITAELWGDLDGTGVKKRSFGRGMVFRGMDMQEVLDQLGIRPDFEYTSASGDAPVNYIHRQIGDTDAYFVTNRRRQSEELVCTFRVEGRQPELWNPETGEITPVDIYDIKEGRTTVPVSLDPAGSVFVVFRSPAKDRRTDSVEKDGMTLMGTEPFKAVSAGRYPGIADNFTISLWVKPEVDTSLTVGGGGGFRMMGGSTGFLFYPPSGEEAYGKGHAACGLTVGRNGICLYERSGGNALGVLAAETPISGWTHVAVVYRDGAPSIYVNGKKEASGKKSGSVVHPGINEAFEAVQSTCLIGDMTKPDLIAGAVDENELNQIIEKGLPDPDEPPAAELAQGENGVFIFWQDGSYSFRDSEGGTATVDVAGTDKSSIDTPWEVSFPAGTGTPESIALDDLTSLHKSKDEGVRYFSGTATYTNRFAVESADAEGDRSIYLDLGRVEVSAEVLVNGKKLGILWKAPYRLDITDAVKAGVNELEVRVATLWPNRLIGDEQLPEENKYGPPTGEQGLGLEKLPDWYLAGEKKPGSRITFASWKHYRKDSPLLESGLLGPVTLRTAVKK